MLRAMVLKLKYIQVFTFLLQILCQILGRVLFSSYNLKEKYDLLECDACGREEETQEHILLCTDINTNKLGLSCAKLRES